MMKKPLPTEVIVGLYNKLASLSPKDPDRRLLIQEAAQSFTISPSTVRRALKNYSKPHATKRNDYNQPRKISKEDMLYYCELIAALKIRSTNRKGKQLSTPRAIAILEDHGVELENKN